MYTVVKYPDNYSMYASDVYADCVKYLNQLDDLFNRFTIRTEKTETFLTVKHPIKDTVYSIEYVIQN